MNLFTYKKKFVLGIMFMVCLLLSKTANAAGDSSVGLLAQDYEEYSRRFEGIQTQRQITDNGFAIIENQIFSFPSPAYGELLFIPALDVHYNRLAVFLAGEDGAIIYKTEQLDTNNQNQGQLYQPNKGIAAVAFQDINGDGLIDILLITFCEGQETAAGRQTYKVGDVLFQQPPSARQAFYRDYRISAKLNRYGMNKSIKFMTSYLVGGYSTEFLYTADTIEGLLKNDFSISEQQSYWRDFEKWGRLLVVPGTYTMAEYSVFMIYLVNEQGYIVWSFQPMQDYESLYALRGVVCKDIDGDGLMDIVVLGRYISEESDSESVIVTDYCVYYQRSSGFYEDTEVKAEYQCREEDTAEAVVERLRTYWGWN